MIAPHNRYLTPEAAGRIGAVRNDKRAAKILQAVPLERIISAIDSIVEPTVYDYFPASIYSALSEVESRFGPDGLGFYKKRLVVEMIDNIPAKIDALNLPQPVLDLYPDMLDFVTQSLAETPDEKYLMGEDIVRDLRLTSTRSIPCGAQIVDNCTYAPKSLYRNNGLVNNLQSLWLFYGRMGGLSPLYRIHTDTRYLKYFNAAGWDECYLNIAEIMRRNPHIRGMIGTSWFYDPQLETISPRLAYLRKRPQENGAYLRYGGPGDVHTERATATSNTRRELYEKGEYIPTCYTLMWARKDLLRWADRQ